MDTRNFSIVRQSFANAVFSHKVQEVAAENASGWASRVKNANILVTSAAFVMLLLQVGNPTNLIFTYIGTGIAAGEILFLIVQLTFNFEQITVSHKNSALKYMQLRDKYRSLIVDIMNEHCTQDAVIARRDSLQAEYQVISDLAPQTGPKEYVETQKRLNTAGTPGREQFTWSDAEIDQYLPETIRLLPRTGS